MAGIKTWADLDLSFHSHPNTQEISLKINSDAIVGSVRNLLLTNYYERPFRPRLGCHLRSRLFDPMSFATTLRIKDDIIGTITNFEPRVQLRHVDVQERETENGYLIKLDFFILNEEISRTTTFFLSRDR